MVHPPGMIDPRDPPDVLDPAGVLDPPDVIETDERRSAGDPPVLLPGPAAPQPPHVATERLGEQRQRGGEHGHGGRGREGARRQNGQNDALGRRDHLAPVSGRQRRMHPRQESTGQAERVTRRADGDHPATDGTGGVHTEHQDQECVDFHVEQRAEAGHGFRTAGDPTVNGVEDERDTGQRDQRRHRYRPIERVRDQGGHAADERRPGSA